jgi:hypothetical protein
LNGSTDTSAWCRSSAREITALRVAR